jgi:hypothetical protein
MKVLFVLNLLLIFLAGTVLGGVVMHFLDAPLIEEPLVSYQTINFPESNSNLYASARVWGLTGDHEEVRICSSRIYVRQDVEGECMTFFDGKVFYRQEHPNHLTVFTLSSSPENQALDHLGRIQVTIHEVRDYADLENKYDKQGLTMIVAP